MLAFIIAVLAGGFGAAAVGALVGGLFWLTLIAFAMLLLTGAVGLSLLPPIEEGNAPPATRKADVRLIETARILERRPSRGSGRLRSAA